MTNLPGPVLNIRCTCMDQKPYLGGNRASTMSHQTAPTLITGSPLPSLYGQQNLDTFERQL
jgi:hypothetical protein